MRSFLFFLPDSQGQLDSHLSFLLSLQLCRRRGWYHLTAADMHIDYDAALSIVQSLKARQYDNLVSRTKLFIKDAQQLYIASNS